MRMAQEEIFGPVVSVIPVDNFEQAIEVANGVPYGLSASIYTRNVNQAFAAMRDIVYRHRVRECADDRGGDAFAVWWDETNGKWPSRGSGCGDRFLHRMEDALHRLFG